MKKTLTASLARIIMSLLLLLIIIAMAAGTYFAYSMLQKTAEEVASMRTEAADVDNKIQNLISLKDQLDKNSLAAKKAAQIVADSKSYMYQNQAINDLSIYASRAGIPITSFTFSESAAKTPSSSASSSGSATANANASSAEATAGQTPAPAAAAGPKTTTVSIQLGKDISYENFLHFLHLIEMNVTRMQVTGIALSTGEDNKKVSIQSLDIEVYIQ